MKKLLTQKVGGSGTSNLLLGTMVIFTICSILSLQAMLKTNITAGNFVEDNLTNSTLGCLLADPDEYGTSNTLVIYDLLENHAYSGQSYISHLDSILLDKTDEFEKFYNLYMFNSVDEINTIGNLTDYNISGEYGPIKCYENYLKLLKTNMGLNTDLVPIYTNNLPNTLGNNTVEPNRVSIECFKVYNCINFMVKHPDFETDVRKPVISVTGDTVYMYNDSGIPLYKTIDEVKAQNVVHSKIIEFKLIISDDGTVFSVIPTEYEINSKVYVTDELNNKVIGQDGNNILVEASGVYNKISLCIKLGDKLAGDDIQYKRVAHERTAFIESSK